jgi:hypothetical protein
VRFQITLWDKQGFIQEQVLENATNLHVSSELNGENSLSFDLPINDTKYTFLDYRKIIRLEDTSIDVYTTKVINAPTSGKNISVLEGANFDIGDFLIVFESPNFAISRRLTAAVPAGANATLTLDSYTGINAGDYLHIEDENNAETFQVLTAPGSSITANLANSYSAGASVTTPARSFIGKITSARKGSTTTINAESASASAVVIEVNSTDGFIVGDYVWLDDGTNSEATDIIAISVGGTVSITVSSLSNSYSASATVTNYSFTLSRRDFLPAANSEVRKVNFTTYQIATFTEQRTGGMPIATINCEHISYRLNDQYFLIDGRGDISYSVKGSGVIKADRVDIDTLLNDLLIRQVDSSGNPIDIDKFIKGDLYSFRYSTGTISATNGSTSITGVGTYWDNENVSSGSILSIEGDSTSYTVARTINNTSIVLSSTVSRESGTGLKYHIISKGIHTSSSDKIGTCDVRQIQDNQVDNISIAVDDGTIASGAIFRVEGDSKNYYVEKVLDSTTLFLTEDIERDAAIGLNFVIKRDEREITFSSATKLLGCINEIAKVWSDDRQAVWYEIEEDKSINIRRKPIPDDRDPTSDLVIRYSYNTVKNLQALRRIYDETEFGNRVLALGARSGWINAFSNITTSVIADADNSKKQLKVTAGDTKKFRPGDPIQILQSKVDITNITSATQVTITKTGAAWNDNQFAGGLVVITSGEGSGQIRAIISNTATQITISRAWDTLPIGANAIVAKNIGNTYIRGFGYNKFKVDSASSTRVDVYNEQLPEFAYRGGILNVIRGTGISQSFEIRDNEIDDYDGDLSIDDSRIRINGTFNPTPDTSSIVEVVAPAQLVEEYRSTGGTNYYNSSNYGSASYDAGAQYTSNTVIVSLSDRGYSQWRTDMWNSSKLYMISGVDSGNSYTVADTTKLGNDEWQLTISGTFSTTPDDGDGFLLIKETDLPLSVASGLRFTPAAGDEVVLLLKETGGALTVGKYADYRSTVVSATQTTITVQSGDGSKFEKDQIIFIGARTITSDLLFNIRRGDQTMGQVATIASKSSDILTLNETLNPVPQPGDHVEIMAIVDSNSIIKYGEPIELTFDASDINDPRLLYYHADKFLQDAITLAPRYEVDFAHLYELDPKRWKYDNYELGDTVRVIDDDLNIDISNLRIISEEYDPNTPADVKIQVAKLLKSQIRTQSEIVGAKLDYLESTSEDMKRESAAPVCVYWDDEMKLCGRDDPPNTFCNSLESNRDGRLTREKQRITKVQCQAYTPVIDDLALGTDEGSIVTARAFNINNVDNDAYDTTHVFAISLDYEIMQNSQALTTGVWVSSTGSKLEEDKADVRIQIDTNNEIVPQDEGAWTGAYVQAKRAAGVTDTIDVQGYALLIGKRA